MESGTIRAIRGDTLEIAATYLDEDGQPVPLDTISVLSQIRIGGQVFDVAVAMSADVGKFTLTAPLDAVQRVGLAQMDVEFRVDGQRQSARRWIVHFERDVTDAS